ncbi:gustatory receptor for sugar taste 64e [Leptinotarsa decemlineata]|uniref:gustatory receptor for sugar taste 64e n=1 Tax=Leptinotarsa decemlineata TaxID=7539 RepID=UPI003D30C598
MVFYSCTFLASVRLIKIARHWSYILREWSAVEMSMRGYFNETKAKRKFVVITAVFMSLGIVEHIFFIMNGIFQSKECQGFSEEPLKVYFQVSFQNYFSFIDYNIWIGAIIKFANTISTFTWIFTDLFITLISIAMTSKFEQIFKRLEINKVTHEKFWKEIRHDYQKLYNLSKSLEKHLSFLVLVSYFHNIFFLCIQLYNSLSERTGAIETAYFFISFGFLVLRILTVSMYGAWLNEEAKKPLDILYCVPSEQYSSEVARLIEQICTNPVGLSGSGFFLVTKNFLLQMAGTIVTFELMLFQFAPVNAQQKPMKSYDCI